MALVKIRYKGLSDVRIISSDDLKARGINVDKDLVWSHQDGSASRGIMVDGLSEELLNALRTEGTFTITEVDKDTKVEKEDIIVGKPLDDTGSTVTDSTTGQTDKKN
jgi:hypothetical protein